MYFRNKVIWITGASSGIGAELAAQLARQGAKLVLTARRPDVLEQIKSSHTENDNIHILPADITDNKNITALCNDAVSAYGHIDIVIHSAGTSQRSLAEDTTEKVYRQLMEVNFFAPVLISKNLLPHFKQQGTGHIVAISSMAGLMGFPMRTGYAAAKHALKGFFETLQTEHNIPGMHITIVSPGRINTPISLSALTADGAHHGVMDKGQEQGIPVQHCAGKILAGIENKKKHVIIARGERLLWWIWWLTPAIYYRIARKTGLTETKG